MGIAHARDCRRAVVAEHDAYGIVRRQRLAANPRPGGYAHVLVPKTRVPRDTKTCQPSVEARKGFAVFSTETMAFRGLSI